jgi:hypothetical protein
MKYRISVGLSLSLIPVMMAVVISWNAISDIAKKNKSIIQPRFDRYQEKNNADNLIISAAAVP